MSDRIVLGTGSNIVDGVLIDSHGFALEIIMTMDPVLEITFTLILPSLCTCSTNNAVIEFRDIECQSGIL